MIGSGFSETAARGSPTRKAQVHLACLLLAKYHGVPTTDHGQTLPSVLGNKP
jgi:hypothetical protein